MAVVGQNQLEKEGDKDKSEDEEELEVYREGVK